MLDINSITITGNLTRDPDLRSLPSGMFVCRLRIASNTSRKVGDEWKDKPNYFDVVVWAAAAERAAACLVKGSRVAINGRLEYREYETEDGSKRSIVEIIATAPVLFLDKRKANDATPKPEAKPRRASARRSAPKKS